MAKKIRRVVTGHNRHGKSVFVSDGPPTREATFRGMPGFAFFGVWATDHGMTAVPGSDDPTAAMTTFVPGPGGTRLAVTVFPPATKPVAKSKAKKLPPPPTREQMAAKIPGLAEAMESDDIGMHTTDTVDYDIIISGELWLELDDGKEVHLKPGDIVVQNGTRHAWHNRLAKPCVMYSVLVGAPRK